MKNPEINKVCVVTGTRAEYGLLLPLLKVFKNDSSIDLQILVTGMHLSPEFGLTFTEIEKDGFDITEKIEILLSSDTNVGISKAMGLALISFSEYFQRKKPDWIFVLGDRFETFAAATSAYLAKIPLAHLHGGETTEGSTDEAFRHAITKMSYLHFTSSDIHRKRVIQMGEDPSRVFNVGAIGLDNIFGIELLSKTELSNLLNFNLDIPYLLVTFHPATLETNTSEQQFRNLLMALDFFKKLNVIFTLPNADAGGRIIINLIEEYVSQNNVRAKAVTSLGQVRYLSALKYCKAVVGNSSSGLIEAPSFNIPTIDIGDRQKGREKGITVINAEPTCPSIVSAINKALSNSFYEICKGAANPYGKGDTAMKIDGIFRNNTALTSLKKTFFDL